MAAVFHWCEDNGTATGSPNHGTTRNGFGADTNYPTDCNWKNADDISTGYASAPIGPPPANSYTKYQYGHFVSGFNQISSGLFAHTAGSFGSNITLKGTVTSTYATPGTATNSALTTDMTSPISIGSGLVVSFATSGPENATPSSTLSAAGYSQYLATQLQIASGVSPGDSATATLTFQYNEN